MVVPAIIKQLDPSIYKTAMRAEQLHSVKPIIAYWCNFWAIQQILENMKAEKTSNEAKRVTLVARGNENPDAEDVQMVHTWSGDSELTKYASDTMKWMEDFKQSRGDEKAVVDDDIAQLYVEQFAQETLDRAQRVVNANKVTATTANTFDAAATFFGLINTWGKPDKETLQKIKYAKWNAMRILKAYKDGLDPNDSNPKQEDLPDDLQAQEDAATHDGTISPGVELPGPPSTAPRPVTIEDDPEDAQSLRPADQYTRRDSAGVSLPHSPASSVGGPTTAPNNEPAPGSPPIEDLPSVPTFVSPSIPDLTPEPAPGTSYDSPPMELPSAPSAPASYQPIPPQNPPTFAPSPHSTAAVASPPPVAPTYSSYGTPSPQPYTPPTGYPPATSYTRTVPQPSAPPANPPQPAQPSLPPNQNVDDAAIAAAQKHAKWAISALNFEDVTTAVRELRKALQQLGQS